MRNQQNNELNIVHPVKTVFDKKSDLKSIQQYKNKHFLEGDFLRKNRSLDSLKCLYNNVLHFRLSLQIQNNLLTVSKLTKQLLSGIFIP